jgi:hypothetical protein
MTSTLCSAGADGLCGPNGVGFDKGGNLFIADTDNNRVLEYDAPASGDTRAERVFGQPDFTGVACNTGGVSATSLCTPTAVAGSNRDAALFIADFGNQRVLRFNAPFCIGDFQLTPETRTIPGFRSTPKAMTVKGRYGLGPGTDVLHFAGRLVLLEQDGTVDVLGNDWQLTFRGAGGFVYEETLPYLRNTRATVNGGVFVADRRDAIYTGIEYFRVSTRFVIPGNDLLPQRDNIRFKGYAVGLDLSEFTDTQATVSLQVESKCFTTELTCRGSTRGWNCNPAR